MAIIAAAIIETLGLTTVYVALWTYDYNTHKRKTDPSAPFPLSIALGIVYLVSTLGLIVFLEVWPVLATYAPAIFPFLAVVGALNLAMIAKQEEREAIIKEEKAERKAERNAKKDTEQKVEEKLKEYYSKPTTRDEFLKLVKKDPSILKKNSVEVKKEFDIPACQKTVYNWIQYAKEHDGYHAEPVATK